MVIIYDAKSCGYSADDVQQLIKQVPCSNKAKVTMIIKNAHYFNTEAFVILNEFLERSTPIVLCVLLSADKTRIFPPLLNHVIIG